jgi:hypothetical protein
MSADAGKPASAPPGNGKHIGLFVKDASRDGGRWQAVAPGYVTLYRKIS